MEVTPHDDDSTPLNSPTQPSFSTRKIDLMSGTAERGNKRRKLSGEAASSQPPPQHPHPHHRTPTTPSNLRDITSIQRRKKEIPTAVNNATETKRYADQPKDRTPSASSQRPARSAILSASAQRRLPTSPSLSELISPSKSEQREEPRGKLRILQPNQSRRRPKSASSEKENRSSASNKERTSESTEIRPSSPPVPALARRMKLEATAATTAPRLQANTPTATPSSTSSSHPHAAMHRHSTSSTALSPMPRSTNTSRVVTSSHSTPNLSSSSSVPAYRPPYLNTEEHLRLRDEIRYLQQEILHEKSLAAKDRNALDAVSKLWTTAKDRAAHLAERTPIIEGEALTQQETMRAEVTLYQERIVKVVEKQRREVNELKERLLKERADAKVEAAEGLRRDLEEMAQIEADIKASKVEHQTRVADIQHARSSVLAKAAEEIKLESTVRIHGLDQIYAAKEAAALADMRSRVTSAGRQEDRLISTMTRQHAEALRQAKLHSEQTLKVQKEQIEYAKLQLKMQRRDGIERLEEYKRRRAALESNMTRLVTAQTATHSLNAELDEAVVEREQLDHLNAHLLLLTDRITSWSREIHELNLKYHLAQSDCASVREAFEQLVQRLKEGNEKLKECVENEAVQVREVVQKVNLERLQKEAHDATEYEDERMRDPTLPIPGFSALRSSPDVARPQESVARSATASHLSSSSSSYSSVSASHSFPSHPASVSASASDSSLPTPAPLPPLSYRSSASQSDQSLYSYRSAESLPPRSQSRSRSPYDSEHSHPHTRTN